MALQQLNDIFGDMPGLELRGLFLDVVRSIPDTRDMAIDFLVEQRGDLSLRRTVSVDNLVEANSAYAVSTPARNSARKLKAQVKCAGHHFVLHNYRKPSVCSFTNMPLEGVVRQGYNCTNCLLDCHPKKVKSAPRCLGLKSMKARKMAQKKERKTKRKTPRVKNLGSILVKTSLADNEGGGEAEVAAAAAGEGNGGEATVGTSAVVVGPEDHSDDPTYIDPIPVDEVAAAAAAAADPPAAAAAADQAAEHSGAGNDAGGADDSDGSSYREENSSDEDEDTSYENSSDDDIDTIEQVVLAGHTSPAKSLSSDFGDRSDGDDDDEVEGWTAGGRVWRPRLRTGARADWRSHGKSFRVRMNGSRKLSLGGVRAVLDERATLAEEFDAMPLNRVNMMTMPKLTADFNRYMNILPNNDTRVVLSQLGDDETSTYINANWIDGYGNKRDEFIACQGPLDCTVHSFWRMVWETGCRVIVMNTGLEEKGVDKCARYWPASSDEPLACKDFTIESVSSGSSVPEFVESKLRITRAGESRELTHLWWTEWPDKGVPKTANGIGEYISRTREAAAAGNDGPIVIHCSAGIGRTGCFLAINYCMQQFDELGHVDILNCVCRLRQMRGMTVQTESQYRWIHTVMLRYMEGKLYEREMEGEPGSPGIEGMEDKTKLTVRKSKDRPLGFQLERKRSSRYIRRGRRKSVEETEAAAQAIAASLKPPAKDTGDGEAAAADARGTSKDILIAGATYERGQCLFRVRTFVRATTCDICESMLTGLALQGLRCSGCKRNVCTVCLGTLRDEKCEKRTNVKRQKSGLPSWPPQRPSRNRRHVGGASLQEESEPDE
mmetsp:Transcript_885/g.2936  ORF Transcript_885/g.2936 Transcript_885/m.2936 type:complete len:834 (-) Transcript_885:44-2545(-)